MKRLFIICLIVTFVCISISGIFSPCPAKADSGFKTHVDLPVNLEGILNKASYTIRVPANWNGTLLVYAHGYTEELPPPYAAPGEKDGENLLLSMGYAIAGTANRNAGWAVKEGIQNTLALTNFFKGHIGDPNHIILWGFSMGSVITLKSIEKYPGIYDGAIAGCAVGAGTPLNFDLTLGLSLAYDVTFGWPSSWGAIGDVRDDLDFDNEVLPILISQYIDPGNFGKFEFIRLVCDLPMDGFYSPPHYWFFTDMFYATQVRSELEQRAHGPVAQNLDHLYSMAIEDITYLGSLGVDASALLTQMNGRRNIKASTPARKYVERYSEFTGNLKRPVITIHTRVDGLVREANEGIYQELVNDAGKGDLLVQVFTDTVGHCTFTPDQLLHTVVAMESWLDTGVKPEPPYFFPAFLGFIPGFMPPEWPFR